METIKRDIIESIAQWLNPLDIVRWSIAQRRLGKILKPLFFKRVIAKITGWLRRYFNATTGTVKINPEHPTNGSYDDFVAAMSNNKAVISGSFILQMINGENYPVSDIDIYNPLPDEQTRLWPMPNPLPGEEVSDVEIVLRAGHLTVEYIHPRYVDPRIQDMREFKIVYSKEEKEGRAKINTLQLTCPAEIREVNYRFRMFQTINLRRPALKFIESYFDFDILKNCFWYDEDGTPRITIHSVQDILNKVIYLDYKAIVEKVFAKRVERASDLASRIYKYQRRGFTFVSPVTKQKLKLQSDDYTLLTYTTVLLEGTA